MWLQVTKRKETDETDNQSSVPGPSVLDPDSFEDSYEHIDSDLTTTEPDPTKESPPRGKDLSSKNGMPGPVSYMRRCVSLSEADQSDERQVEVASNMSLPIIPEL